MSIRRLPHSPRSVPLRRPGWFGPFGGRFVPETLWPALEELERAHAAARRDPAFRRTLADLLRDFVGRPTPLTRARRLEDAWGLGPGRLLLKREDLNHTGAHKINNCLGQALLAVRMRKRRIIAETGAGQHGVATATACALLDLECVVYMGAVDMERQAPNVSRMRLLGATVVPVRSGSQTLKDATNEALRDWVTNVRGTHYILGSTVGPHPFPTIVREFQSVIGREARAQFRKSEGRLPDVVAACVGGGSNSLGTFSAFLDDASVRLVGVEGGGRGAEPGEHAATLGSGRPGVLHGAFSYLLQNEDGQVAETHSVSAGLDYPGVGPEHSFLKVSGRAKYVRVMDGEALQAGLELTRREGILPALESAHALAWVRRSARALRGKRILVTLSGRGDKDLAAYETAVAGARRPSRAKTGSVRR